MNNQQVQRELPDGWRWVRLGEVATDIQPGFASRPSANGQGMAHLRPLNMTQEGALSLEGTKVVPCDVNQRRKYKLQRGDLIFNNTNSVEQVGKVALFDLEGEYVFSNHITRVRVDEARVLPEFLYRYLFFLWRDGYFTRLCQQWVNQAAVNTNALEKVEIPLPPLSTQRRLADLLTRADALRRQRAAAAQRAADFLPALFTHTFGDPATNPKEWEVKRISEIAVDPKKGITTGPFGTQLGKGDFTDEGPEVFGIYSVGADGGFRPGRDKHISPQKYEQLSRFSVLPGDVLISRMGTVGRICVVPDNAPTGIVSYHLIRVRIKPDMCHPFFFAHYILASSRSGLGFRTQGAIMGGINAKIVAGFSIFLPPLPLQHRFAAQVEAFRAVRARQAASRARLDDLFQSLLHRAFSGEL